MERIKRRGNRAYKSWQSAVQRCHNKNDSNYPSYGAKGIIVCDEWRSSFDAFYAYMGKRPEGKTLDRYPDRNGNYEPGNCRWATAKEQAINRDRSIWIDWEGERLTIADIAAKLNIEYGAAIARYRRGQLHPAYRKGRRSGFKLTDAQVAEIRQFRGVESQRSLSRRYGVCAAHIWRLQTGRQRANST